jgi:NADP-dependent 3-hydroxy acid dehydrogenase YdfG
MTAAADRTVVITGASGGLGAAIASHYAANGATLGLIARRTHELERFAAACASPCATYAGDVRDSASLRAAAADFAGKHGTPDIVMPMPVSASAR